MKTNIGNIDRLFRLGAAAVLATLIVLSKVSGTAAIISGIIAAVLLITATVRTCPLYLPFGISTLKKN